MSIERFEALGINPPAALIDIGDGSSRLIAELLAPSPTASPGST